jgi:hypothetical protein
MSDKKKFPDNVNPERREFLEKVTKGTFIIPTVISVMMLNQKLNLSTANAISNDAAPCLSFDTLISTPGGNVPITDLRPDMSVFTMDWDGNKVIKTIELVSKITAPDSHLVCHVILNDGREMFVSGGHPTADGREISNLNPSDILDGAKLVSIEKVPYKADYTYDLLPAGETGLYWAYGVLLGSTLSPDSSFFITRLFQPEEQQIHG